MGSTRPTAPTAFPSRRIQDDMAARTVPVSTPRLHVQQNRPAPFTKGGRLVGATCAQTIRKPRLVKRAAAGASAQRRLLAGRGTGCPGERHDIVRAITQRPRRNAAHFETGESMRDYGDDTRGDLAGRNRFSGRGKPPVYLIASIADFVSATMHGFEHRLWQRPSRVPITNSSGYVGGQINRACFQGRPVISAPRGFAAFAVHVAPSTWRCSPYRHSDHSTGLPVRIWPYRFRTHMFGQMSPK